MNNDYCSCVPTSVSSLSESNNLVAKSHQKTSLLYYNRPHWPLYCHFTSAPKFEVTLMTNVADAGATPSSKCHGLSSDHQ